MIYAATEVQRLLQSFLNRVAMSGSSLTAQQSAAVRDLLIGLDGIGLAKFTAVYPFAGMTAASHALDLVGANDITWSGAVNHDAHGATSDGSTGYGDTGIASTDFSSDDTHLAAYITGGTRLVNRVAISGSYLSGPNRRLILFTQLTSGNVQFFSGANAAFGLANGKGLVAGNNDGSNTYAYEVGASLGTDTHSAGTFDAQTVNLMREPVGDTWYEDGTLKFVSMGTSLTAGEHATLNTVVEAFQVAMVREQAYFNDFVGKLESAGTPLGATEHTALGVLVSCLEGIGMSKFAAVYPFIGATAVAHAIDLMGDYHITWSGTVTHDTSGITPNGSTGYGDMGLNPSTNSILGQDSSHVSLYGVQDPTTGQGAMVSCKDGSNNHLSMQPMRGVDNIDYYYVNSTIFSDPAEGTPPDGFFVMNRELSSHQDQYQNGTRTSNDAAVSSGKPNADIYIGARNNNGSPDAYADINSSFISTGSGLTAAEITTFNTAVQAYASALSRAA